MHPPPALPSSDMVSQRTCIGKVTTFKRASCYVGTLKKSVLLRMNKYSKCATFITSNCLVRCDSSYLLKSCEMAHLLLVICVLAVVCSLAHAAPPP